MLGHARAGQLTAYSLLVHGATLSVVGFTMDKVEVRLSNLMAFDARALGNWGCPPEAYPAALDLVLDGKVQIAALRRDPSARRHQPRVRRGAPPRDQEARRAGAGLTPQEPPHERPRIHDRAARLQEPRPRRRHRQARRALREAPGAHGPTAARWPGLYNAWITLDNPSQYNCYTTDMVKGVILALARRVATRATSTAWSSPAPATRPSAPAATPRNTPSTTPATRRSTASTCACSTTWSAPSWPATSR